MAKNVTFRVSYDMSGFAQMQQSAGRFIVEPSAVKANRWFIQEDEVEREVTREEFFSSLREIQPDWFIATIP
jgi:hypothetical protein